MTSAGWSGVAGHSRIPWVVGALLIYSWEGCLLQLCVDGQSWTLRGPCDNTWTRLDTGRPVQAIPNITGPASGLSISILYALSIWTQLEQTAFGGGNLAPFITHPRTLNRCGHRSCARPDFAGLWLPGYLSMLSPVAKDKGHINCIIGSKVTAALLNEWILPIGGVLSGMVCACSQQAVFFWKLKRTTKWLVEMLYLHKRIAVVP